MLLVGLRGSIAEVWVALISSLCFGLMHRINIFLGQSVAATIPQIGHAFLQGLTFYVLRRVIGSLIGAMVLHGAWDFSVFSLDHSGGSPAGGAGDRFRSAGPDLLLVRLPGRS